MKRMCAITMILSLLLSGCTALGERIKEPVTFYYLQEAYTYGADGSAIESEEREASGHRNDLSYLLTLYLMGPTEDNLKSPIPRGVIVTLKEQTDRRIVLELSNADKTMTDLEYSLACSCLSLTCFNITNAAIVTIKSGARSITLTKDNLMLSDNSINTEETQ